MIFGSDPSCASAAIADEATIHTNSKSLQQNTFIGFVLNGSHCSLMHSAPRLFEFSLKSHAFHLGQRRLTAISTSVHQDPGFDDRSPYPTWCRSRRETPPPSACV